MTGGGRDEPPRAAVNGGEFILSLLQKPQLQTHTPSSQQLVMDPAVTAVGPSVHYLPPSPSPWSSSSNTQDPAYGHTWTNFSTNPTTPIPPHLLGLPRSYWNTPSPIYANNDRNQQRLGFTGINIGATPSSGPNFITATENAHNLEPKIVFGSLNQTWQLNNVAKEHDLKNGLDRNRQFVHANQEHDDTRGNYRSTETKVIRSQPPPGFSKRKEEDDRGRRITNEDVTLRQRFGLNGQLDKHGPSTGSKLPLASQQVVEESLIDEEEDVDNVEDLGRQIVESLLLDGEADVKDKKYHRDKDIRSDKRGQNVLSYGMRLRYCKRLCRRDIVRLNAPFLAIYESLIPPEEVKANQLRLFTHLEKLVHKEWPEARLYLYGSCGNSFGVSKSDVDVCLSFQGADINKPEVLLKLASILESDNLQNVQALTRARVPIVKLMHPETGISCDICINNLLAVVNTKLLRDYAQIDGRLRQLAFIVKHWAKSRGVNETYQGTLSSYAYVLMCIHFLQHRRPAILPCLQMMEPTFSEIIDGTEYAFYDRVERLYNYGSQNKETIAELVWGFFNYWAYRHDYTKDAISVRTGGIISKRDKDWTRRVGNDRHLICIEDPFEISHDLGRVVDKFSIKVLREEFERAAEVLQFDPNPCVTLFERYVSTST